MYSTIEQKDAELQGIHQRLAEIKAFMDKEVASKQAMIERLEQRLKDQQLLMTQRELRTTQLEEQLLVCRNASEGTKQLINKLLNDISNYQKEINWYKSTFERRSLLGILKEKLIKRPH